MSLRRGTTRVCGSDAPAHRQGVEGLRHRSHALLTGAHVPADIPGRDGLYGGDDDILSKGNTTIVDPLGRILAGPLVGA